MSEVNNHFKALRSISHTLNSTMDEQVLVKLIVQESIQVLDLKAASIYLISETSNIIMPMYQEGLSEEYMRTGVTNPQSWAPSLRQNGYFFAERADQDPRLDHHQAKAKEGIASILIVPVQAGKRILGGISCYTSQPREFSSQSIELMIALGEQAGYAIEHARLVQHLHNNNQLLLDFTTSINSSLNLKKVLHILTADIAEHLELKGSSVLLFDENRERLQFITGYGLSQDYASRDRLVIEESVRQTLGGHTVYIPDVQKDERVKYKESKQKEGIVSILSVPIMAQNQVLGGLRLYSGEQREFQDEEIMLVQSLAQIGGLAIQNASMYTKLKEDMQDLENDIWSHRLWF
ncbi:MAG: GAF domain-containing protein [Desulfohalobiaceae bacterium]